MIIDIDSGAIASAIIAGFIGHAAFVNVSIKSAVSKLGEKIAEKYATKDDLDRHVETMHKDDIK
jgi:hypothetical protein